MLKFENAEHEHLNISKDNERGVWAKAGKDTGNYYNSSADFQATWCSQKLLPKVNYSQTFSPHCRNKQAISDINITVQNGHLACYQTDLWEEFVYMPIVHLLNSHAENMNLQATWEKHMGKAFNFSTSPNYRSERQSKTLQGMFRHKIHIKNGAKPAGKMEVMCDCMH